MNVDKELADYQAQLAQHEAEVVDYESKLNLARINVQRLSGAVIALTDVKNKIDAKPVQLPLTGEYEPAAA